MRRLAFAFIACLGAPAQADIFDQISGTWGLTDRSELSCAENPHRISFTPERSRARFVWEQPMLSYTGEWLTEGGYDVISHDETSVTMALDGEQRLTGDGAPVVWILRLLDEGNRYCWGRTDWAEEDCIDRYMRCPAPVPVS